MRNVMLVCLVLLSTSIAAAEPERMEANNEDVAMSLAISTTVGGLGIVYAAARSSVPQLAAIGVIGMLVGPSAGHFYAGEWGHALAMTGVRSAAAIATTIGVIESTTSVADGPQPNHSRALDLVVVGGAAYLIATVYDIVDSRTAARRANALTIAPMVGQGTGTGLVVAGRF
jgi:hypothetical protein